MKKIILLEFIAIVISYVSLDNSQHCDCTELSESECNQQLYWCKWSNNTCISHNQNCENLTTSSLCLNLGYHCAWDSKNLNCSSYQCSNFTGQDDCLTHNKCYWFNKTCSDTFTNCTDYTSDTCSYLTDQNCIVNDTKCVLKEFPANCTDDANCVEDFTSAAKTHKCVLKESKCYEIDVSNPCPKFNDSQTICESYSQCFYFDATTTESTEDSSICRQKQCPDMIDQTTCEGLVALDKSLKVLCEWVDDKCQNMVEATLFTKDNCFTNSLYNYYWNVTDKKCEKCNKLIANTPIYETIADGNVTKPLNTTPIVSTDPVYENINKRCSCRQFDYSDCQSRDGCQWDYDHSTEQYACIPWDSQCASRKSKSTCEFNGCAWVYPDCKPFTQCIDYSSGDCPLHKGCLINERYYCTSFSTCSLYDSTNCPFAYGCDTSQNSYNFCQTVSSCSSYTKENCQGKYLSWNNPCYLDNDGNCKTKFTVVKYQICEDFDDSQAMCQTLLGCAYVDSKCIKGKCYQFTEHYCEYQINSDGQRELCLWDSTNNQCGYQKRSSYYNCNRNNLKTEYGCQMCTDLEDAHYTETQSQPTFGYILINIILIVLIIMN